MYDLILFSQAPADIQYVVYLYDKYKDNKKILILVVNVENNFKYLKSLDLKAKIEFVPLVAQSEIVKFLKHMITLRKVYAKLFLNSKDSQVYFFSNNYDYVTAFFIQRLQKHNLVYFKDIYKIDGEAIESMKYTLKKYMIKIILGINIKFFKLPPNIAYQYLFSNTNIKNIDLKVNDDLLVYKYNIQEKNKNKNLLFFESNGSRSEDFVDYDETLQEILNNLDKKYNIYIKPHPRLGYSNLIDNFKDITIIPNYIPSEMIDVSIFDTVVGIESASIATVNHLNAYSVIDMFTFKDEVRKKYLKEYLSNLSGNQLKYNEVLK